MENLLLDYFLSLFRGRFLVPPDPKPNPNISRLQSAIDTQTTAKKVTDF